MADSFVFPVPMIIRFEILCGFINCTSNQVCFAVFAKYLPRRELVWNEGKSAERMMVNALVVRVWDGDERPWINPTGLGLKDGKSPWSINP